MKTKLQTLRELMQADRWREALKLAASFPRLGEHKVAIQRAWEAMARPEIYGQMGYAVEALVDIGKAALVEKYGKGNA